MEFLDPEIIILLIVIASIAGFVDAIAGGGGLLTLPALLWIGVPPVSALATNKLQGCFSTFSASVHYVRQGEVDVRHFKFPILLSFIGSGLGSFSVGLIPSTILEKLIPVLLIGFSVYFLFTPSAKQIEKQRHKKLVVVGIFFVFLIGYYDGFFGPGTGSLFAAVLILFMGFNLLRATATTKPLNFASNIAALLVFTFSTEIWWILGLTLGIFQAFGAWIGSSLAVQHGHKIIKPILIMTSVAISIKLLI